jgi:hypothetical protein
MLLNNNSAWLSFSGCASILIGISFVEYTKVISFLFYIAGFILIILSISLYMNEKEAISSEISIIIEKANAQNTQNAQVSIILVTFASLLIIISTYLVMNNYLWIGATLYTFGWIAAAFSASMNNTQRLEWTLPGSVCLILGSLLFYLAGLSPGLILASIGSLLFTIGNVMVI